MSIIYLEQGSDEWVEFRKTRIGASDCPRIMGTSHYGDASSLMKEKLGLIPPPDYNAAMQWGNKKEPEIRQYIEDQTGYCFLPQVRCHPEHDWMMASYDGINFEFDAICELKTCREEIFNQALEGVVVPMYYDQIQHQLAWVPEIHLCYYTCLHRGQYATVKVERDPIRIQEIIEAESEFYAMYLRGEVPEEKKVASPSGRKEVEDSKAVLLAEALEEDLALEKELKERIKETRIKLLGYADGESCTIGNLRLTRSEVKGSVDMDRFYKENSVDKADLEKFRKPGTVKWTITTRKKND